MPTPQQASGLLFGNRLEKPFELCTEQEAARALHVSVSLLRKWRREGKGPKFVRLEQRLIRYDLADLRSWLSALKGEP